MMRAALWISACMAVSTCQATPSASSFYYGTWKVTRIITYTHIAESEARMKALIGSSVVLAPGKVVEGNEEVCPVGADGPEISFVDAREEVAEEGITPEAAGLPAHVEKLDYGCMAFYRVGDKLVFSDRGAYYEAAKAVP